ncbi:hypothetical protein COS21_03905 [bacterium (Candidatus Gribaldobacteria) CG02_land_8_20_14_3_00_41_15]|uniref:Nucleotidyl transferase AbiEii/AbiGii toxin family protein n=1 Tax=bacterium (Candidatus Gribaldobacteria) CG02_land_8_20_14_3_00_41_15 TaxID=2014270 RepID=A0A2M7DCW3_9BACT|nr:MAG: hypothetical protein COS21_03905 [bacterium (Candidatus Gribaldobacteria) CG02_land_8_20_14_3_00_41_15]
MFEKVISQKAQGALAILSKQKFIQNFYLAGGTGLALHMGHRVSVDLDFFCSEEFSTKPIIAQLKKTGNFSLQKEDWGTINGLLNDVKIDLLYYSSRLIKPASKFKEVRVADIIDIALMKLVTVGSRGSKKDFIDLYFIVQKIISLEELFALLPKKFVGINYEPYHLILGLQYFRDADENPMPKMFEPIKWLSVKRFFEKEAKKLV